MKESLEHFEVNCVHIKNLTRMIRVPELDDTRERDEDRGVEGLGNKTSSPECPWSLAFFTVKQNKSNDLAG